MITKVHFCAHTPFSVAFLIHLLVCKVRDKGARCCLSPIDEVLRARKAGALIEVKCCYCCCAVGLRKRNAFSKNFAVCTVHSLEQCDMDSGHIMRSWISVFYIFLRTSYLFAESLSYVRRVNEVVYRVKWKDIMSYLRCSDVAQVGRVSKRSYVIIRLEKI